MFGFSATSTRSDSLLERPHKRFIESAYPQVCSAISSLRTLVDINDITFRADYMCAAPHTLFSSNALNGIPPPSLPLERPRGF